MSRIINIAGTAIHITGEAFFKKLAPLEKRLLGPFIFNARAVVDDVYVTIRVINDRYSPPRHKTIPLSVINTMRSLFPSNTDNRYGQPFTRHIRDLCLNLNNRELAGLRSILKKDGDGNKVIADNNSLLIFDRTADRYKIFLRKGNRQEQRWPYNLYVLRLLLRMSFTSANSGIMLHASSVELDGRGYAFIGRGGAGKSTVARLLSPQRILSDDITVIRPNGNRHELFANPWWTYDKEISIKQAHKPVTLKALFFIRKAAETSLKRMTKKDALKELIYGDAVFQQAGFYDNKAGIKSFYLFSSRLVEDIPIFELYVKNDRSFKDRFRELIDPHIQDG
jgi:hypothetical protein